MSHARRRLCIGMGLVAVFGLTMGGCSVAHEVQTSFDVGSSQGPRVEATPELSPKGRMLVASDSLGSQVFRDSTDHGTYAAVPDGE
ncbi:MAG TPA: hypothetical protein PK308_08970 [Phycisphaerales bacterium]|mgnify:CR=1 FL=1|nr:hypothetical protein [Phycisphaerales bacterium]